MPLECVAAATSRFHDPRATWGAEGEMRHFPPVSPTPLGTEPVLIAAAFSGSPIMEDGARDYGAPTGWRYAALWHAGADRVITR